ncbi:sensor histidine kinase [Anaerosporobacter sp.]|uniref:sensor histidine kinase n=1 Tax=Anaerosporobacter sp. TaxID=1872529 RepID=UPI00286F877D|nr:HAMP domain-containing sensor histidine kinase [Anaerosporobacter sp.]
MVYGLIILCGILLIVVAVLGIKIALMRKSAYEICKELSDKVNNDTNTLISISSHDKAMCHLANDINVQLRELRKARHRFIQGDMEIKNAITNISHDLRTPLTAICGYLDLLDTVEKSDTVSRYIEIIENRTEMLKQLTEELFSYSVIISQENDAVIENVVINGVLEESIAGFYAALQEKNITPNIHITEKKIVRTLNRAALSRVFANLLNNAIKYSDGDLDIELTDTGELIFSNTASELNEVQVGRLFDRFYTVEASRKSTGLGLAIARNLIEQMNGTIVARYEEGKLRICIWFGES